ncbi:hypothetical protein MJ575_25515 [Klebsiella pneumoniae]|nr:hypothetical protein MJ575_25515 [Klebsiella pneumoniae]
MCQRGYHLAQGKWAERPVTGWRRCRWQRSASVEQGLEAALESTQHWLYQPTRSGCAGNAKAKAEICWR